MIDAFSFARTGLLAASSRLAEAAEAVASPEGATREETPSAGASRAPRIGVLPLPGDPYASLVAMKDAEMSFKANAAVLRTAASMITALYEAID